MKNQFRIVLVLAICLSFVALATTANAGAIRTGLFNAENVPANDDGFVGPRALGFDANFFGTTYNQLYVNNNGNVTFDGGMSTFTPFGLGGTTTPIIAPFFADVDTRAGSVATFGQSTVNGHSAFGVDWINVGYYSRGADKLNSFQLVLIDRSDIGEGDFDIEFNYDQIQWETGNASGGSGGLGGTSAAAGYSNGLTGDDQVFYEFAGSRVNGAFLAGGANDLVANSNVDFAGRYLFTVRNGVVSEGPDDPVATPEPSTFILLGVGLLGLVGVSRKRFAKN